MTTTGHTIRCPGCRCEFELSAVMRAELEAEVRAALAKQFEGQASAIEAAAEARVREKEAELASARGQIAAASAREADLLKKQRQLAEKEQQIALEFERCLAEETARIREQEGSAARERLGRELADRERQLALESERRLAEETARAREQEAARAREREESAQEQQRLREEEHRQKQAGLEKTIAELQRKLQQGSQQTQGEAQEIVLRDLLAGAFPVDAIEDVPKGVNGADLVQRVHGADGRGCGAIVWESKRTKSWSNDWLPKVRDDQREIGAACAVIVTQALPPDIRGFGQKEGVWVCAPSYAVPLGAALRGTLLEVALARRAAEGSGQKMQLLYEYMTGTEFRNRVEGLVEAFVDMQEELASERRATLTRWKRREKMIDRALENITALCGELQGIAGRQLGDLLPDALDSVKALPEGGGGADRGDGGGRRDAIDAADDASLKELLFELLPGDGSAVGNGSLTDGFTERALTDLGVHASADDYERCKEALISEGRIRRGKGRGGSVYRVVASAASSAAE